jgi:curved DNA-binding protein CbpA
MSGPGTDLYAVLGLRPDATQAEISHAYRVLVRRNHPDTRTGQVAQSAPSDTALQQILDAYTVLRDPERRAAYDEQTRVRVRRPTRTAPRTVRVRTSADRAAEPPIQAGPVYWQPSRHHRPVDGWDRIQNLLLALVRWNQR